MNNKRVKIIKEFARMKGVDEDELLMVDKLIPNTQESRKQFKKIKQEVFQERQRRRNQNKEKN